MSGTARWLLAGLLALATLAFAPRWSAAAIAVTPAVMAPSGGEADWSSTGRIIFEQPDASGITQLYTEQPGGAPTELPSPAPERHKFNPAWSPDGQWLAVQVERPNPLRFLDTSPRWSETLLNGLLCDLYVASADGSRWTKLTDVGLGAPDGVLMPRFSPDGRHLAWSELSAPASSTHPWGVYRLMEGDFSVVDGVPSLSNVRDITPPALTDHFVEMGSWSPDGTHLALSADVDTGPGDQMNVVELDLASGAVVDWTASDHLGWHEHPAYTPDGARLVYMSGVPGHLFSTELVAINRDGSGWTQLTHFNDPGSPEYAGSLVYVYGVAWNPDHRRALVTLQSVPRYPARTLWLIPSP